MWILFQVSGIMSHKYILLLFYLLFVLNGISNSESQQTEEKKNGEHSKKESGSTDNQFKNSKEVDVDNLKDSHLTEKDLLNDFEKLKAEMIKIVEAPDLSKSDSYNKKKTDENEKTEEAFKIFFKKQDKLLRRLVAQVEGYDLVDDREGELDIDDIDNVASAENYESLDDDQLEETTTEPPVELTPEEKEGMSKKM